jgi:hypothetical protein
VVNANTARMLGLAVPQSLLATTEEVIECWTLPRRHFLLRCMSQVFGTTLNNSRSTVNSGRRLSHCGSWFAIEATGCGRQSMTRGTIRRGRI